MNSIAKSFALRSGIHFLNHGSFGACPHVVLEKQALYRAALEAEPVQFMVHALPELWDAARCQLASFLQAEPAGLAMVSNATTGVNAVLRSLSFRTGDEILITNHGYNACSNAVRFICESSGARAIVAELPFPIESSNQIVESILSATTSRTRLALIDHVTSPTAVVIPIQQLAAELASRDIDLLVDGAHAPGMLPLNLEALNVPYYAGNCHKWLCAPKGSGFLYVRDDRREKIHPTVISHGFNAPLKNRSRFHRLFDWVGTSDPTAALCVPTAIEQLQKLAGHDWKEIMSANHDLAVAGRKLVCETLGVQPATPDSLLGSIASIPLPSAPSDQSLGPFDVDPIQRKLYEEHEIEIPIFPFPKPPHRMLRLSANIYNDIGDYEHLSQALKAILASEA